MSSTAKQKLINTVKFLLPAVIIGYLLRHIDWAAVAEQPKNYPLLVAAQLVAVGAIALSFVRWCVLVRAQGIELSMGEAFRLGSIGFLLSFVSAGSVGGDLFKAVFLARRRPGKRIAAVASVLVDRGCGLFGLLLLVAGGLLLVDVGPDGVTRPDESIVGIEQIKWLTAVLMTLGTVALAVLVLGGRWVDRAVAWGSQLRWIGPLIEKIGPPLRTFHDHPLALVSALVMSVGVQGMLVISMYLIACGLYADPPTLAEHFVIVPMAMLASALPLTPAGLGVLEFAMNSLYKAFSANASGALVALIFEIVKIVVAVLGTVFYWTAGAEVRNSLEAAEA